MRHDQLKQGETFDIVDLAAIWPRPDGGIQAPLDELEAALPARQPATAVPDVPAGVGRMVVGAYALLILVFAATMAGSAEAAFMIGISAIYVAIFLAVPRIFLAVEADSFARPSMEQFMARGIDTFSGHMSGRAALAQMFAVPVLVIAAITVIGTVGLVVLP